MSRLTDDERAQIVDLYNAGLSLAQVATCIHRAPSTIRYALIAANVARRRLGRNQLTITEAERAEAIRLYADEGLSTYDVATHLGRAQSAVWRILADAGVPRRSAGWPKDASTRHRVRAGAA